MRMIPQAQMVAAAAAAAEDDSGYSTEADPSSNEEGSGGCAGGGNITSTSDSDPFFTDDDDFEDVQERIEYIRAKQEILQRASNLLYDEEEAYNAATARESSRTAQELQEELAHQDECTIWGEAKDILRQISSKAGETEQVAAVSLVVARPTSGVGNNHVKRSAAHMSLHHAKFRGEINLTGVNHVASLSYDSPRTAEEDEKNSAENEQEQLAKLPTVAFEKGQWMAQAQALVWMSLSSSSCCSQRKEVTEDSDSDSSTSSNVDNSSRNINPQDCRWKGISDPFTCSLGLVPPSNISIQNAVNIEEAIAFTSEARLVTQATPPFCVVFVNKAFLILAGLTSKESLIGKPVESILMVPQDFLLNNNISDDTTTNADAHATDSSLHCILNDNRACRMQVVPVIDRFRRRRLSMSSYSCMSHLMIRLHDTRTKVVTIAEVLPSRRTKVVRNNNLQQQQQQQHGGGGSINRGGGRGDELLGTFG